MRTPVPAHPVALLVASLAWLGGCAQPGMPAGPAAAAKPGAGLPASASASASAPTGSAVPLSPALARLLNPNPGTVAPTPPAPPAFAPAATAPSADRPAVSAPAPGGPPPFAVQVRDARRIAGPLVLWQKDDKVYIELAPEQLGTPYLLSPKIKSGIGEAMVLGGLMSYPVHGAGGAQVVEFIRIHNQVRMQARNLEVLATPGTPEARAVAASYSASLMGSTPVASQPHPERKSILIEANGLFLSDMLGVGMMLQRGLRQNYALDPRNTVITAARGSEQATVIETLNHYYTANLATVQPGAPGGSASPSLPRYLPDTRSLLVGLHYSLAPLPATPMAARAADPRVGLFSTTVLDFSDDTRHTPRRRLVNRWRLEKKDPAAELSDPVKPVTFWIDRNVPLAYREVVRDAILEWNKAFEKVGLSNAIKVQQQAEDADFDTLDFGYASVRWMMNADPAFGAIGPSHVDPRTGEILDADIAFEGMSSRTVRGVRSHVLAASMALPDFAAPLAQFPDGAAARLHDPCLHGALAAEQLGYALDVLEARGDMDPGSADAQAFVLDYIKDSILHEVGHALGLRHNFRASRAYTESQLSDPEFTRVNGTSASVMEYRAVNLARHGERAGTPFQTTLGPYDYWAVEYAYKPMPPGSSAQDERQELLRIAARSHEPLLAFGTDEDHNNGIDPESIQLDLGADPIAFAAKRLDIARDLFQRQETRTLSPQQDYSVLRRSISYALSDVSRAVGVLMRQIGGVRTLRDFPGSGRDPILPVGADVQRQALDLVARSVLSTDGLRLSPALQRRLAPDFLDRSDFPGRATEFSLPQRMLDLQRAVLSHLMSDALAVRILDSVGKFDRASDAFTLSELYTRLDRDIWRELGRGGVISEPRRNLQRDHVNRLATQLLRPAASARADMRSLLRSQAQQLLARIAATQRRHAGDAASAAHLADSVESLRLALSAPLQRASP